MSERRRPAVRQGPQGREFSRRLVPDRAAAPPAGAGLLSFRARRRRRRRPRHRAAGRKAARCWNRCAPAWWAKAMPRPKAWRCAPCWPNAACRRSACAGPAGSLPPRLHQAALSRLGRSDRLLPLFAPCRWAALCWTCMAKAASLWPANDALCAALQVINHLQDCAKDYRELNRVYIPEPMLAAAGIGVEALARSQRPVRPWRRDRRPGAQERRICWTSLAALRPRHPRRPACAGSRSHPDPGRRSEHHADAPRSAVRSPCIIPRSDVAALFLKRFPAFALMRLTTPAR